MNYDKRPCLVKIVNGYYELIEHTLDAPFAVLTAQMKILKTLGFNVKKVYYGTYLRKKLINNLN